MDACETETGEFFAIDEAIGGLVEGLRDIQAVLSNAYWEARKAEDKKQFNARLIALRRFISKHRSIAATKLQGLNEVRKARSASSGNHPQLKRR